MQKTANRSEATLAAAAAFNAVAAAAAVASSPEAFLDEALARLASLLDVDRCAILLAGEDHGDRAAASTEDGLRALWSVPLQLPDGRPLGTLIAYGDSEASPDPESLELATAYGAVIALGLDRLDHRSGMARYEAVVTALTAALDARDDYTGRHSSQTSSLARQVGERLRVAPRDLDLISHVAVLHDVGKLGIPTRVLQKQGPLDADELVLMREHPVIGERILKEIPGLDEVASAIRHEHERWDGNGYPDGFAGEQIPLASRIVFACDAWHAMTSDRPYRPAMNRREAIVELRDAAGTQFDPRVAQALLEILGDTSPPDACSPSESRDRRLTEELSALAGELGAEDLFVFRHVGSGLYSHLGGVGRGAGWAGNIELHSDEEHHLRQAVAHGAPSCVELGRTGRIIGPYYARTAVLVPSDEGSLVVFGSSTDSVAGACTDEAAELARRALALVVDVSPAKRLADELEVLAAVREVTAVHAETASETLVTIAARARGALSAEFAAVATIPSADVDGAIGVSANGWEPRDADATARALARYAAHAEQLPMLCQDVGSVIDAPEGFTHADGVSSMHALPIGSPAIAVMLVVHAEPGLRGFTALCQRVASGMSDAAELVIRRAIAQERLREENTRLAAKLRTDALTGVASRSAWEEALRALGRDGGRGPAPISVAMIDVDGLKRVNDEAGHVAGDELLRRCAQMLAGSVRSGDLVARIGGDEFGVLLRGADQHQVDAWCGRLHALVHATTGVRLSYSLGHASVPPCGDVAAAVLQADRRMYESKLARRATRS
jgi:diguanylate cyclase (GGDEF)-like protein